MLGGRDDLRSALDRSTAADLVSTALEADCVLVDVGSLTPAAHAAACGYPLAPADLPLFVVSAFGADDDAQRNPYLSEVAHAEQTALAGRTDWCVLRCAPLATDLMQILAQIQTFSAVYGCFGHNAVPWLAVNDVVAVMQELLADADRRVGQTYELTGGTLSSVDDVVARLGALIENPAEVHRIDEGQVVEALTTSIGWSPDVALRVPYHQRWLGAEWSVTDTVERALGRPPSDLDDCLSALVAARAAADGH